MNDLFPSKVNESAFRSGRLRTHKVLGDGMSPTLRSNHDFVLIKPVDHYVGEGIYLVGEGTWQDLFRLQKMGDPKRRIRLFRDNPVYSDQYLTMDEFDSIALGIVVAMIKVQRDDLLLEAMGV